MQGYRLSKEAQDDLKEIKSYTRMTWGDKQTQEYLSDIKKGLETLVMSPELGKIRNEVLRVYAVSVLAVILFFIDWVRQILRLPVFCITEWMRPGILVTFGKWPIHR